MPLIINGKIVQPAAKVFKAAFNEIFKLPEPPISTAQWTTIDAQKTVLCLQREVLYCDEMASSQVAFIGSKHVLSCILAHIYNDTEHLIIHFDSNNELDLNALLRKLKQNKNLKVTLVGGINKDTESETILHCVLKKLYISALTLGVTITIENQKLLDRNSLQNEDKYLFVFDKIIGKIAIHYRKYFDKQFDFAGFLSQHTLNDFKSRDVSIDPLLNDFIELLQWAVEIPKPDLAFYLKLLETRLSSYITSESRFLELARSLFSKEGYHLLNQFYSNQSGGFRETHLANFVFDLKTQQIIPISSHVCTPHESMRHARVLIEGSDRNNCYFLCYDGQYYKPLLSKETTNRCQQVKTKLKFGKITHQEVARLFGFNDHYAYTNVVINFIKSGFEQPISLPNSLTLLPQPAPQPNPLPNVLNGSNQFANRRN